MLSREPRRIGLTLVFVAALGAGSAGPAQSDEPKGSPAGRTTTTAKADDANLTPAAGRMFVVGRVLDPEGKPVPGAAVMVQVRNLTLDRAPFTSRLKMMPLAAARADSSGRFRIDAPRTSSTRQEDFTAVAMKPGYGVGWATLDPDDDQPTAEISLRSEQVIHGRVFDVQGKAVPDVTVSVRSIQSVLPLARASLHDRYVRRRSDGVFYWYRDAHDYRAWPRPVTTYADTVEPVPHSPLRVGASSGRAQTIDESETDDAGLARINSWPADRSYSVTAYPPEGQPYLVASGRVEWPKGALEQTLEIALPRGVLVHGKVTEEGTGKPVAGARVDFTTRRGPGDAGSSMSVRTNSDGSFRLGADPEPGHVFMRGTDDGYVFQATSWPGVGRFYSHAYAALDLKPGTGSQEVNLTVRRGATVHGRVVGPDGQSVRDAWIFSSVILNPTRAYAGWTGSYHGKLSNGRFEIRGLAPDAEVPVYFLAPERKLGAVVKLSVKSAATGPIAVRLEPCGSARARLVDPDGKPITKPARDLTITMVVTPGPARNNNPNDKATGVLSADEGRLTDVDPINYAMELVPDGDGRIMLPVLIPGATYRFTDYSTVVRGQTGPEIRKEFTVKPGEKLILGDIRIGR